MCCPKVFILENVKGLLSTDYWPFILDSLKNLVDYSIHFKVLNTRDYGIPQNRERLYIIGTKGDFKFPEKIPCVGLSNFVENSGAMDKRPVKSDKVYQVITTSKASFLNLGFQNFGISSYEHFSPCILASGNLWNVPMHRRATITELLSLQGFPKDFIQVVSDTQMKKQIGNSMSVNVLVELFKEILKQDVLKENLPESF